MSRTATTSTATSAKKSALGQFYTTNYNHILQNFEIQRGIPIIEPFAGNGDLIQYINEQEDIKTDAVVEAYDIDPQKDFIVRRDTLLDPPSFAGKFVLTNPPYLARNKNSTKEIYDKYGCNDLYKCFIEILIRDVCEGGILIVPLNFICSMRAGDIDLRRRFLRLYSISHMNIFEEPVFRDTAYNVCSFQFRRRRSEDSSVSLNALSLCVPFVLEKEEKEDQDTFSCVIYPHKGTLRVRLNESNNYTIGGEIYNLHPIHQNRLIYKIDRATKSTKNIDCITNILVKCIDDGTKIGLKIVEDADRYIDNSPQLSARSYATLVIDPPLNIAEQEDLVRRFNEYLGCQREMYHSLFLTNYRENGRKRISFQLVFQICGYLL